MDSTIRILVIEDSQDDALLLLREIKKGFASVEWTRIESESELRAALRNQEWNLLIADYWMPKFNGIKALKVFQEFELDIPFILVSGTIGEELAVQAMKAGANDYLMKDKLHRLVPAIERELKEVKIRNQQREAEKSVRRQAKLLDAINHVLLKTLESADYEGLAKTCADAAVRITASQFGFISETQHTGMLQKIVFSETGSDKAMQYGEKLAVMVQKMQVHGFWQKIQDQGEVFVWNKSDGLPSTIGFPAGHLAIDSFLAIPLKKDNHIVGILTLINSRDNFYSSADILDIKALSVALAQAISYWNSEADKKKAQTQLLQAQKMDAIGNLAGGIAHDFNNLLTIIQGHAQIMMMNADENDPKRRELKHILSSTSRAANLTRQLLLFSRKQAMQFAPINLNNTVNDLLKMVRRLIGENIKVETYLDSKLHNLEGDEGNIEQVLMNLVVNARDAMPQGGRLIIKTENIRISEASFENNPDAQQGDFVQLTIEDNGVGIPKEFIGKIFEPFFSTKGKEKGTGLGLAVVYGIIKKHNGWINVYSEPGEGSVFKVYLPVHLGELDDREEDEIFSRAVGNGERILLIEDEDGVRNFSDAVLTQRGYTSITAAGAREAREIFQRENGKFDLIFSDVILPDGNGLDVVLDFIKTHGPIPVIMGSGYTEERIQKSILQHAGFRFLQKPYSIKTLLDEVKDSLSHKK